MPGKSKPSEEGLKKAAQALGQLIHLKAQSTKTTSPSTKGKSGGSPAKKNTTKGAGTASSVSAKKSSVPQAVPRRLSLGVSDRRETIVQGLGTLRSYTNSGRNICLVATERKYYDSGTGIASVLSNLTMAASGYFIPMAPTDNSSFSFVSGTPTPTAKYAGWCPEYVRDVFKYFTSYKVHGAKLIIVPKGWGANTATAISLYVVPRRGGRPDYSGHIYAGLADVLPSAPTITDPDTSVILASKGAVEFPCFQGLVMDLKPFIAGGRGADQNEFDCYRSTSDIAGTDDITSPGTITAAQFASTVLQPQFPFSLLFGGSNMQVSATGGFAEFADVFIQWDVTLQDFNVAWNSGSYQNMPGGVRARSDVKGCEKVPVGVSDPIPVGGGAKAPPNSPTQSLSEFSLKTVPKSALSAALAAIKADHLVRPPDDYKSALLGLTKSK